jgi:hypothetical protein
MVPPFFLSDFNHIPKNVAKQVLEHILVEEGIDIEEVKKFMNISSIYYPKLNHIFKEQISLI